MKTQNRFLSAVVICLFCGNSYGGAMTGVGVRDAASFGSIEKWSFGVGSEWMRRDIKITDNGKIVDIEARTVELFVGRDVTDWLTVFATFGGAEFRSAGEMQYGDMNIKGSLGFQGNLWQTEIMDPEFMTGSLTFKSVAELSIYQIDQKKDRMEGDWMEFSLAFPLCYEMFADKPENIQKVPYSLAISLGPALSIIDGSSKDSSSTRDRFREDRLFGGFGAVDIYLSHNLSIGCQVKYFNHATIGGSMTYHF